MGALFVLAMIAGNSITEGVAVLAGGLIVGALFMGSIFGEVK